MPNDINKMDWNQANNLNGTHVSSENQQYLIHTISTAGSSMQPQAVPSSQNLYSLNVSNSETHKLLKSLLYAPNEEQFLKVQHSLLKDYGQLKQSCVNPQGSARPYNASHNTLPEAKKGVSSRRNQYIPQPTTPSYSMQNYSNPAQQIQQQPPAVRGGQIYGGNNYNVRDSQVASNYQAVSSYGNSQPRVTQSAQNVEKLPSYASNKQSVQYRQILPKFHIVHAPLHELQKGTSQAQQYNCSVEQNTVMRNPNECAQSQQTHMIQSHQRDQFAEPKRSNNHSEKFLAIPSTLPLVLQQVGNPAPIYKGVESSQTFSNQSNTMQTVQNPPQKSYGGVSDQTSSILESQSYGGDIPVDNIARERQELNMLLNVYQNVKTHLLRIANERKIRKQNANVPNTSPDSQRNAIANSNAQSFVTVSHIQNLPLLNQMDQQRASSLQLQSDNLMQSQDLHASRQRQISCSKTLEDLGRLCASSETNVLPQINYSVFDAGQTSSKHSHHVRTTQSLASPKDRQMQESTFQSSLTPLKLNNSNAISGTSNNPFNFATQSSSNMPMGNVMQTVGGSAPPELSDASHPSPNANVLQSNTSANTIPLGSTNTRRLPDASKSTSDITKSVCDVDNDVYTGSLEALETCLALWKYNQKAPANVQDAKDTRTEIQEQCVTNVVLKEIILSPFVASNEVSPTSGQKVETVSSNVIKGQEPQIAIVSPLVQPKIIPTEPSTPRIEEQCPVIQEGSICSLIDIRKTLVAFVKNMENTSIDQDLQKSESLNKDENGKFVSEELVKEQSKEMKCPSENVPTKQKSSTSLILESQDELDMQSYDEENQDGALQITGICSLAEGNTFYDSSIALMFDKDSSKTEADSTLSMEQLDVVHELSDCSKMETGSCNTEATKQIADQTNGDSPPINVADTQFSMQTENLVPLYNPSAEPCTMEDQSSLMSSVNTFCDKLESNSVTDQLSELLTEFPLGIKNYMSELYSERDVESYKKSSAGTVDQKMSTPIKQDKMDCLDRSIDDIHITVLNQEDLAKHFPDKEKMLSTACEEKSNMCQNAVYTVSNGNVSGKSNDEKANVNNSVGSQVPDNVDYFSQAFNMNSSLCTPNAKSIKENECVKNIVHQVPDKYAECVPAQTYEAVGMDSSPCILNAKSIIEKETVKNSVHQAPNKYVKCVQAPTCEAIKADTSQNIRYTVEKDWNPGSEKSNGVKANTTARMVNNIPDKNLFCCLFSWLTHSYGSAPKCSCKLPEDKVELVVNNNDNPTAVNSCRNMPDQQLCKDNANKLECSEQPISRDGTLDNTKLSPVDMSTKYRQDKCTRDPLTTKSDYKEQNTTRPAFDDKSDKLAHKYESVGYPNSEQNSVPKTNSSKSSSINFATLSKAEKLIIKTDFLKNRHLQKKKKDKLKKNAQMLQDLVVNAHLPADVSRNLDEIELPRTSSIKLATSDKSEMSLPVAKTSTLINRGLKTSRSSLDYEMNYSYSPSERTRKTTSDPKGQEDNKLLEQTTKNVLTIQEYRDRRAREGSKSQPITKGKARQNTDQGYSNGERERIRPNGKGQNVKNLNRKYSLGIKKFKAIKEQSRIPKSYSHLNKDKVRDVMPHNEKLAKKSVRKKSTGSNEGASSISNKDTIYLSPCMSARRPSHENINLTKLEIRHSPEQTWKKKARRKSMEAFSHPTPSRSTSKLHGESPKMLEFKLFPELLQRRHSMNDKPKDPKMETQEKCTVEGIKSKKEAWYSEIPFKKRKIQEPEEQGNQNTSTLAVSTSPTSADKEAARQGQDSKTTFDAYKKMYLEKRCKSLDGATTDNARSVSF